MKEIYQQTVEEVLERVNGKRTGCWRCDTA